MAQCAELHATLLTLEGVKNCIEKRALKGKKPFEDRRIKFTQFFFTLSPHVNSSYLLWTSRNKRWEKLVLLVTSAKCHKEPSLSNFVC